MFLIKQPIKQVFITSPPPPLEISPEIKKIIRDSTQEYCERQMKKYQEDSKIKIPV